MKLLKEVLIINLIVLLCIILSNLFNFRLCLFYNIFNIPCPGCGITRSIIMLSKGEFSNANKYSITPIIIIVLFFITIIWRTIDYIRKQETLKKFLKKYETAIIAIFVIYTIIIWIINLNNPLLY